MEVDIELRAILVEYSEKLGFLNEPQQHLKLAVILKEGEI